MLNRVTVSPTPMEQQQIPESNAQKFMKSPAGMVVGVVLALGLGILLLYLGIFNQCCGLGYLLVAVVALYIPKMFGMTKTQYLAVFGVVFFLVTAGVGAFAVSKPMFENNSDVGSFNDGGFTNVKIEIQESGGATIIVDYAGSGTNPTAYVYQVKNVTYQMVSKTADNVSRHQLALNTEGHYTATIDELPSTFVYQIRFGTGDDVEKQDMTTYVYYTGAASSDDIQKFCLIYNAYTCGIIILLFFLMMVLTAWSRKNLEKARARMEAEGRLYPQGYGRCKECGSIVLPGETCCRKCGAYIDVPDELRHRKVDMVECSECGAEIPEDAKVCPKCGATFDEEEEVVYVDSEEKKEKEE